MDFYIKNKTKTVKSFIYGCAFGLLSTSVYSKTNITNCSNNLFAVKPQQVLPCFIKSKSSVPASWKLVSSNYKQGVKIFTYSLTSQFWPEKNLSDVGRPWIHKLTIFVPNQVESTQALLLINGGTQFDEGESHLPGPVEVDFIGIAKETKTIVADLQDVPNQYLRFDDGVARLEDGIVAYTWNQYMNDPGNNAYWPVHLPMAKAVVKAMDVIQDESVARSFRKPEQFVIAGASKRGWTAWLTTLIDERVNGVVPIVIDFLNTKQNLKHIYRSLGEWPLAFFDYVQQGVTDRIDSPEFNKLMKIEDPLAYLSNKQYRERLSVPKYIINASSDDFFVPDSLNQYIERLPGETTVRIVPNQRHYIDTEIAGTALKDFYRMIVTDNQRPQVLWNASLDNKYVEVRTRFNPIEVKLWKAYNPEKRDFRITSKVHYEASPLHGQCAKGQCVYRLPVGRHKSGYTSQFVEFIYKHGENTLTVTSPAFVTPNTYQ